LPHWPITRLLRNSVSSPDRPLVTVETVRGARRLAAVGLHGEAQGLRSGQSLTEARTICPELVPIEAEPAADLAALARLAVWCERYTPMAAIDPPDGLWLDITGCAGLFGGEAAMQRDLATRLKRHGISCRLAIADAPGAAWALAHAEDRSSALPDLPLAKLRLNPDIVIGLRRLGLRTIGDLQRLPRADIAARFGGEPMLRLDQALGVAEEAIEWPRPPVEWLDRLAFAEPIGTPEDLANALSRLAERLCGRLAEQNQGGQSFTARFFRVDEVVPLISVTTAQPIRDPAYLTRLLREKLETVDPGFGVEVMALEADRVAPLSLSQGRLTDLAAAETAGNLAAVVDTLGNRLGPEQVWRVAPYASHVPERAVQRVPVLPVKQPSWVNDPAAPRPIRLLRRPEAIEVIAPVPDDPPIWFRWRGASHRITAAAGPERIAAEWWRGKQTDTRPVTDMIRDYYRVEDADGARFWIFRAGLHAADRMPNWYLHGLFA
jgi:protein ImuB